MKTLYKISQRLSKEFDVDGCESIYELIYEVIDNLLEIDPYTYIITEEDFGLLNVIFEENFSNVEDYLEIEKILIHL